jgi:hypothetical protein
MSRRILRLPFPPLRLMCLTRTPLVRRTSRRLRAPLRIACRAIRSAIVARVRVRNRFPTRRHRCPTGRPNGRRPARLRPNLHPFAPTRRSNRRVAHSAIAPARRRPRAFQLQLRRLNLRPPRNLHLRLHLNQHSDLHQRLNLSLNLKRWLQKPDQPADFHRMPPVRMLPARARPVCRRNQFLGRSPTNWNQGRAVRYRRRALRR